MLFSSNPLHGCCVQTNQNSGLGFGLLLDSAFVYAEYRGRGRLFSNNLQESDFSISQAFRKEMNFKFYCNGIGFLLPLPFMLELSF